MGRIKAEVGYVGRHSLPAEDAIEGEIVLPGSAHEDPRLAMVRAQQNLRRGGDTGGLARMDAGELIQVADGLGRIAASTPDAPSVIERIYGGAEEIAVTPPDPLRHVRRVA